MWNPPKEISEYLADDSTDSSQSKRVGVDEQYIKFKSSSNFQVMKKIIRSKLDKTGSSNSSSPNNLPDPPGTEPTANKPEPSPADMLEGSGDSSSLSNDVDNDDRQSPSEAAPAESAPPQEDAAPALADGGDDDGAKPPESTIMCRDFIRGTCKRPGTCKYAHKCDKTQLFGVYTFCRNFQNKVCTLPNCKYVHATVFEEQEFYRTGKLPPHVLAPKVVPPPSSEPTTESRVDIPTSFANPPPMLPPSIQANSTMFPCHPTTSSEPRMFTEEFPSTSRPAQDNYSEPPLKKCKSCDPMELRYSCLQDLIRKKRENIDEYKRKQVEVDGKKEKLNGFVTGLIKLTNSSAAHSGTNSIFNMGADKYKIIDQIVNLNAANRLAIAGGDSSSSSLRGENYSSVASVLANLLSDNQTLSTDGGRRE